MARIRLPSFYSNVRLLGARTDRSSKHFQTQIRGPLAMRTTFGAPRGLLKPPLNAPPFYEQIRTQRVAKCDACAVCLEHWVFLLKLAAFILILENNSQETLELIEIFFHNCWYHPGNWNGRCFNECILPVWSEIRIQVEETTFKANFHVLLCPLLAPLPLSLVTPQLFRLNNNICFYNISITWFGCFPCLNFKILSRYFLQIFSLIFSLPGGVAKVSFKRSPKVFFQSKSIFAAQK